MGVARERMLVTQQEAQTEQQRAIMTVQPCPATLGLCWGELLTAHQACEGALQEPFCRLVDEQCKHARTSVSGCRQY